VHFALVPGAAGQTYYVEMVQPNDLARGTRFDQDGTLAGGRQVFRTRYALFGHDVERGVVLRARLRGCFLQSATPEAGAIDLWRAFQSEPLPLGP
jgi:hypothetical protein